MKVLIAEDDKHIRAAVAEILEGEGYQVLEVEDGRRAIEVFHAERPDFVCLDIMMPGKNGYDVCREIRKTSETTPVIFLSAKSEEVDKVLGLELGADDYVMKPFGRLELVARVRAVSRRCLRAQDPSATPRFFMRDLEVVPDELRARRGEEVFELSLREVKILRLLHARAGQVVDRDQLFRECWGIDHYPNSRTIDQHIAQLRKKIERNVKSPEIVETVHGVGYRFDA